MANEPVRDPEIAGLKLTFTVHDAPPLSDDPQVLLATAKFPVAEMEFDRHAGRAVIFERDRFVRAGSVDQLRTEAESLRRGRDDRRTRHHKRQRAVGGAGGAGGEVLDEYLLRARSGEVG